jgi:hypothetical protein
VFSEGLGIYDRPDFDGVPARSSGGLALCLLASGQPDTRVVDAGTIRKVASPVAQRDESRLPDAYTLSD